MNMRCSAATKELIFDMNMLDPDLTSLEYLKLLWYYLNDHLLLDYENLDFTSCNYEAAEILCHAKFQRELPESKRIRDPQKLNANWNGMCVAGESRTFYTELGTSTTSKFLEYAIVKDGFSEYIRCAQRQHKLCREGEFLKILAQGLGRLSNLSTIRLREGPTKRSILNLVTLQPCHDDLSPHDRGWHPIYLPPLGRSKLGSYKQVTALRESTITSQAGKRSVSPYEILIEAISSSQRNTIHLNLTIDELEDINLGNRVFDGQIITPPSLLHSQLKNVYSQLHSFSLNSLCYASKKPEVKEAFARELRICLSLGQALTHIALHVGAFFRVPLTTHLSAILSPGMHFPHLRKLQLKCFAIDGFKFAAFLEAHYLEVLELHNVKVEICSDMIGAYRAVLRSVVQIPDVEISMLRTLVHRGDNSTPRELFQLKQCFLHALSWVIRLLRPPEGSSSWELFDVGELRKVIPGWRQGGGTKSVKVRTTSITKHS